MTNATRRKTYRRTHPEKIAKATRTWADNHKPERAAYAQARRYGLTVADVDRMQAEQEGCCAICNIPDKLTVDHSHRTLKVRGLLCLTCNAGIGFFGDRVERLMEAVRYLQERGE